MAIKKIVVQIIKLYQKTISPDHGVLFAYKNKKVCVFYPTCSEYTIKAIEKYGVLKGILMGVKRIIRCVPWQKNRIDDVK